MQEKTDRRVQRTRKLLFDALIALILEKGYEKITVQDILNQANVGRSTFYAHFQDKEDLLFNGFQNTLADLREMLPSPTPGPAELHEAGQELSLYLFRHAAAQRQIFRAMMGKQGGEIVQRYALKYLSIYVREIMQGFIPKGETPSVPLDILVHFMVSSFLSLLTWWLDADLPYSAEEMNRFYQELVHPGVRGILDPQGRSENRADMA